MTTIEGKKCQNWQKLIENCNSQNLPNDKNLKKKIQNWHKFTKKANIVTNLIQLNRI